MRKAKQVNTNKNKCHTININNLDPSLLDIKKNLLVEKTFFIKKIIVKLASILKIVYP